MPLLQSTPCSTLHAALARFKQIIKIGLSAGVILHLSVCSAASEGMRYKALADVMDDYMRTKDPAWLIANIGEPTKKDTQYSGYTVWRWETEYRRPGRVASTGKKYQKTPCQQIFIIENSSNNIVGWQTDCAPNVQDKMYGEISAATPVPAAVIPEPMLAVRREQQAAAREREEAARKRVASFADRLATFVGKREEDVYSSLGALTRSETLSNGTTMRTYSKTWRNSHYDQVAHTDALLGEIPYTNGMTYTDEECSYTLSFKNGIVAGYDAGDCFHAPGTGEVPFRTPAAPWKAL